MRAIEVDHAGHPAFGYIIGSRTTTGLKKEYQNLDGAEIRELVKSGVSIKADPIEKIEVAYTGDTCARGLMRRSISDEGRCEQTTEEGNQTQIFDIGQMFQADLLLSELTFLDSSEDDQQQIKASQRGHLHIKDLESIFSSHDQLGEESERTTTTTTSVGDEREESNENATVSQQPKNIVFYHLSAKYQPARRALDLIAEGIPHQLRDRCQVAITSILSQEEKSCDDSFTKLIQPNGCISLAEYIVWKEI